MQNKYSSIANTYSSYYFKNTCPKTQSLKFLPPQNKQNITLSKYYLPTRQLIPHHYYNQNTSLQANVQIGRLRLLSQSNSSNQIINNQNIKENSIENKILNAAKPLTQRTSRITTCQQIKKAKQNSSSSILRKKSVKFSDQPIELPSILKMQSCQKQQRKRSSSILKSSSSQDLKSKSQIRLKQAMRSGSNIFTISEYKNTIVRQRYNQIIKGFQKNQDYHQKYRLKCYSSANLQKDYILTKFTDSTFPLIPSSVFRKKHPLNLQIKWARISEVYSGKKIVVKSNRPFQFSSIQSNSIYCNQHFTALLNLIGKCEGLLQRILQNLSFNQHGIYLLKIFNENEWKCIIIDDYIPVIPSYQPIFTQLKQKNIQQKGSEIEIWPLLLQKAYASVLGSYEAVHCSNLLSYFCEMMGLPLKKLSFKKSHSDWKQQVLVSNSAQTIIFGYSKNIDTFENTVTPNQLKGLVSIQKIRDTKDSQQFYLIPYESKMKSIVNLNNISKYIQEIYLLKLNNMQYYNSIYLNNNQTFGKKIKGNKFNNQKSNPPNTEIYKNKSIIKTFTISGPEQISIILKQKHHSASDKPQWLRIFLFMKELDGYRWIQGKYQIQLISFSCVLEAGEYFIVVLPDWVENNSIDLILMVYSRLSPLQLKSFTQTKQDNIIEKACSDYVQRLGKLIQINKWICTYTIVDPQNGLIIQNINNQRRSGKIKVLRNIKNLKPKNCCILPYNKEFYNNTSLNHQVQILIDKMNSYSVILMLFGGKDTQFLNTFNFGS